MNIRYVAKDLEWTPAMKSYVWSKIVEPVSHHLRSDNFEISTHLQQTRKRVQNRKPEFEIWLVLQTFDGRANEIVRCHGSDFYALVNEASMLLRSRLSKVHAARRRFILSPFAAPAALAGAL